MQKSLDFYTSTLGFRTSDTLIRKDGRIAHASVGFDAPLLMLSPVENVHTPQTKEDLALTRISSCVKRNVSQEACVK